MRVRYQENNITLSFVNKYLACPRFFIVDVYRRCSVLLLIKRRLGRNASYHFSPTGRGGGSPSQKEPQKEQQGQEGGLKTAKSGATQVTQPSVVAESVDSAKKEGSGPTELVTEEKKTSRPRYMA